MGTRQFRYSYDDQLVLDEHRIWVSDFGTFGASIETVESGWLTSLRRALAEHAEVWGDGHGSMWLSDVPAARFDDEKSPQSGIGLRYEDGELLLWIDLFAEDSDPLSELRRRLDRLASALRRRGVGVAGMTAFAEHGEAAGVEVLFRWSIARRTVGDAYALARDIEALASIGLSPPDGPSALMPLLEAGLWTDVVGLPESQWLEVKRAHYQLEQESARRELAKDVAALANADGGVLVVGFKTRRQDGVDVICKVAPCPIGRGWEGRYEKHLRRGLHPWPAGASISSLEGDAPGLGLLVLGVPEQSDRLRPFVVRGSGSGQAGPNIGVPIRRGEDTEWLSAEQLHAWLAAGCRRLR